MSETGVVKFACECDFRELAPFPGLEETNAARQELRALGLLGVGEDGVGFGNVSLRNGWTNSFYITGSGTGALCSLGLRDYARVVTWDFARNWLRSEGCAIPSAESFTHAAIYATDPNVRVVIHGHDAELWRELLQSGPFTAADVPTAHRKWRARWNVFSGQRTWARRNVSPWRGTRTEWWLSAAISAKRSTRCDDRNTPQKGDHRSTQPGLALPNERSKTFPQPRR
jgi:hypothetical protein